MVQYSGASLVRACASLWEWSAAYMNAFFKMDIFFVVSTIGFVVVAVLVFIILLYVIRLLRTLNHVADSVEDEAEALKKDLDDARASIKRGGKRARVAFARYIWVCKQDWQAPS